MANEFDSTRRDLLGAAVAASLLAANATHA